MEQSTAWQITEHQIAKVQQSLNSGSIAQTTLRIFADCDENRDGRLCMYTGEFLAFIAEICQELECPTPSTSIMYSMFQFFDAGGKGYLDSNEALRLVLAICNRILGRQSDLFDIESNPSGTRTPRQPEAASARLNISSRPVIWWPSASQQLDQQLSFSAGAGASAADSTTSTAVAGIEGVAGTGSVGADAGLAPKAADRCSQTERSSVQFSGDTDVRDAQAATTNGSERGEANSCAALGAQPARLASEKVMPKLSPLNLEHQGLSEGRDSESCESFSPKAADRGSVASIDVNVRGSLDSRRATRNVKLIGTEWEVGTSPIRAKLVIITDPGQDLDDEMTFILLRCMQELGLVDIQCVVTNLHPSFKRALLCRGALDMLGMHDVPVGYGSDGGDTTGKHGDDFQETAPYMLSETSQQAFTLPAGRNLLYRIFVGAEDRTLSLCLISSLKDAAGFLRDNEKLFVAKVKDVTIMGGVKFPPSPDLPMEPDSAHNNEFDRPGAEFFYRRVQELGIQLTIVSRNVAYVCSVPRDVYDDLAQSGSPIGWRLRNAQRTSIEGLWKRAASADVAVRMGLPARCDAQWFKKTFCGNDPAVDERGPNDHVWDLVKGFNMYDSMALIAAIPIMRRHLFTPSHHTYLGVNHAIIGASNEDIGTTKEKAEECVTFLKHAYKFGISLDHHHKTQIIISMSVQPNIADTFLGLALLRTLIETDTMDCLGIVISSAERYIDKTEIEEQATAIRAVLADLGIQSVRVCTQHSSNRENRLEELYAAAPPTGVRLLITHALSDAAGFAMMAPKLFRDKTLSVVLMGGILNPETEGEMLQPDMNSSKVASDAKSATYFVKTCQELGVPLTVVFKSVHDLCRLPRAAFEAMSSHGGDIGKKAVEEVKCDVEWFHSQVKMSHTDKRRTLPAKYDMQYFLDNFCNTIVSSELWDRISAWKFHIPLLIIAAVPKVNDLFFGVTEWKVKGTTHQLVGLSGNSSGSTQGNLQTLTQENLLKLKSFVFQLMFKGILMNLNEYETPKLEEVPGVGSFIYSDAVPDCISITRELKEISQVTVSSTFLQNLFADF